MLTTFFSHFAFAQFVLCALLLFRQGAANFSVRLFALLMLLGGGYILGQLYLGTANGVFTAVGFIAGNALPGVFWLTALSVFTDKAAIKNWQYGVAASTLLLPSMVLAIETTLAIELRQFPIAHMTIFVSQLVLELSLICYALYLALINWRDDLIQERRYIRGGVISVSGTYIVLVIVFEQVLNISGGGIDIIKSFMLAGLATTINYFLLSVKFAVLFVVPTSNLTEGKHDSQSIKALNKIIKAMEDERLYQQEGLTIAGFAKHLAIHEYKLRQLINGQLNYRNFNDFLNHYRIKEVTEKLSHHDYAQTPVLTLALDSGFRSLSSFNKAFKQTHGTTPTEFRKQQQ